MKPVMQVNAMQPTFTPILYRCILLLPPLHKETQQQLQQWWCFWQVIETKTDPTF
jgi:hypothetical protein